MSDAPAETEEHEGPDTAAGKPNAACFELQATLREEPCVSIDARRSLLGCEDSSTDLGCMELAATVETCRRSIADFLELHETRKAGLPAPTTTTVLGWDCNDPKAPVASPKRRGYLATSRTRRSSDLGDLSVASAVCMHQYRRVRPHPRVDDEVLAHMWRSNACERRYSALFDALPDWWQFRVRDAWRSWDDSNEQPAPWETSPDMEPRVKAGLVAAMSRFCGEGSACSVLGRCGGAELPEAHPVHPRALTCVSRSDEECARAQACRVEGRCTHDEDLGFCVPGSDEDCARATLCTSGECGVRIEAAAGWGAVPTCGLGTTPETSGADTLGFVHNPVLAVPPLEVEVISETVSDPLGQKFFGLTAAQRHDVESCMQREAAALHQGERSLNYMLHVRPEDGFAPAFSPPSHQRTASTCLRLASGAWTFPSVDEVSYLSFRVRGRPVAAAGLDSPDPPPPSIEAPLGEVDQMVETCAESSDVQRGTSVRIRYRRENGAVTRSSVVESRGHRKFAACIATALKELQGESPSRNRVETIVLEAP